MNWREQLRVVGFLGLGLGIATLVVPDLLAVEAEEIFVTSIALVTLLYTCWIGIERLRGHVRWGNSPDVEIQVKIPTPGRELEDVLSEFADEAEVVTESNTKDGLRTAAIAVLTRYEGLSPADARERIVQGTWTDDPVAAAFLSEQMAPLTTRIGTRLTRESSDESGIRHTVDAFAATLGLDFGASRDGGIRSRVGQHLRPRHSSAGASPGNTATDSEPTTLSNEPTSRRTNHWRGVSAVALLGIGVGVLTEQPGVLLAGAIGVGYAAYAYSGTGPDANLSVDRTLSEDQPELGGEIEVTVTVTNEGEQLLPDLRLVDGVPAALEVTEGTPRTGTPLRPGEGISFSYVVRARRGTHEWGPVLAFARDFASANECERRIDEKTRMVCRPRRWTLPEPFPLRKQVARNVGRVDASSAGEGVEFYATREYRRGDPLNRIDWNHRARSGDLATLQFIQEQSATVVLVIDARKQAYRSPGTDAGHAVDRAVEAVSGIFPTLIETGDRVGLAAVAPEDCWLPPRRGGNHEHVERAYDLLATHPALDPVPHDRPGRSGQWWSRLGRRLPTDAQIVFLSPLCDDVCTGLVERIEAHGHPVTVVSPDPTSDRTPANRLAAISRRVRITDLRRAAIPVIDWSWDEPLAAALARYNARRRK